MRLCFFAIFLLLGIYPVFSLPGQPLSNEIWKTQVAGRFYPENEIALKNQIHAFFKKVPKQSIPGRPIALISPHAGYQYSGQVAAYGYSAIKSRKYRRVIIISPSLFMGGKRFRGASILNVKGFESPLGTIPVDHEACNQLLNPFHVQPAVNSGRKTTRVFGMFKGAYEGEYSLETQLPFLQATLGNSFKLVPIMIGVLFKDDFDRIAKQIKPLIDDETLLVVSSDFTHYGEGFGYVPFKTDIENNIKKLDFGAFERILSKDFEGLRLYKKGTGINASGIIPIGILLKLLPEDAQGTLLKYDTSGRQTNNFTFSVSYASIIFTIS